MKKLFVFVGVVVVFGVAFEFGYLHGSYVKNQDLEKAYYDGYINASHVIGPDEMRQR